MGNVTQSVTGKWLVKNGKDIAVFQTELAAEYCRHAYLMEFKKYSRECFDPSSNSFWKEMDNGESRGHDDGHRRQFAYEYKGQNIKSMPKQSTVDSAGIYMPDLNLHKGFEFVCNLARNDMKRELTRAERKPLFTAYVKACNKYQLVCLPDQTAMPFNICGGSVWDATEGSIRKFRALVKHTLDRALTKKEQVFIQSQWPALTAVKRARIRDQSHTNVLKDGQTIYTTEGRKKNQKLHDMLDAVHGYSGAVSKLRKMLANGAIDHEFYNDRLAELRKRKDKALDILKSEGYQDTREAYGSGRVMHNSKGLAPEKPSNMSKRFAYDGYPVNAESETDNGYILVDNMKSPTVYKDGGGVTSADSRQPIRIKRK